VCRQKRNDLPQLCPDLSHGGRDRLGTFLRLGGGRGTSRLRSAVPSLKCMARARQSVAFSMNEAPDLECQLDLSTAIETLACSAFVGLELGKLGFPEA
jgi:hypothetical protein